MRLVETALALLIVGGLTYFAYRVTDEFPLNLAIAALAFVVAAALMLRAAGRGPL